MKKKILLILTVICCLSIFSAAKQAGKNCRTACKINQPKAVKPVKADAGRGYDLSPLTYFINI